jgi:hypothetical protein
MEIKMSKDLFGPIVVKEAKCLMCNKSIIIEKHNSYKHRFCSPACGAKYRRLQLKIKTVMAAE